MKLFVAESANHQVITLDYCNEDGSCNRVVTFVCDTTHNEILVTGSYYDCGWVNIITIAEFNIKLQGLCFGRHNEKFGIYILLDGDIKTRLDEESISRLWRDGWFDDIDQYDVIYAAPNTTTSEIPGKSIWIGDDDYASGN